MNDLKSPFGEISLLFVPTVTFKALSDAAARRNMTVAQLFQKALDEYLNKPENRSSSNGK